MRKLLAAAALAAVVAPGAAVSHHGWSSYDQTNAIRLTGPLASLAWSNPHGMATMNWQGKRWTVVLAPISRMEARGLSRAMIAPGRQITLVGYPRKDGSAEMRIERIIVGDTTVELR